MKKLINTPNNLTEIKENMEIRKDSLAYGLRMVFHKTSNFSNNVINAIGEISCDEAIEAIKTMFIEEIDKLK